MLFDYYTPIFRTGKRSIIYIKNDVVDERGTEVMSVRWKILNSNFKIKQEEQTVAPSFPNCLAELILDEGEDWGVNFVTVYDG